MLARSSKLSGRWRSQWGLPVARGSRPTIWTRWSLCSITCPALWPYWDEDLRTQVANAAYLEWFGVAPEDMKGMHIRDLLGTEIYEKNLRYIRAALGGEVQLLNRTLVDAFGRTRHTQASYIPRFVDARPTGFFVLVTDITDRVRADQALAASVADVALLQERPRVASAA